MMCSNFIFEIESSHSLYSTTVFWRACKLSTTFSQVWNRTLTSTEAEDCLKTLVPDSAGVKCIPLSFESLLANHFFTNVGFKCFGI